MKIPSSPIIHFIRLFDNDKIMEIAMKTELLKRKKGVLPSTILKVFTLGLLNTPNPSLNQIAAKCEEFQAGLSISKEAIYKRLEKSSLFLQELFKDTIKESIKKVVSVKTPNILSRFKDVKICDSTKITLPNKLADLYPGLGGRNAKSSLKIQGVYSLLSSTFSSIELTKAPGADTTYSDRLLTLINRDELLIKCRLVGIRLPDKIINERRRKANKKAKVQGKELTAKENELLAWNIIITNVPKDRLSAEATCDLYRARWQIELVFKSLKSYLNIDKVGTCGRYQLECLLYGPLIAVIALFSLYNSLYLLVKSHFKKSISILLFVKIFATNADGIVHKLQISVPNIYSLERILKRISKKSLQGKRKRKTTFEVLQEYFFAKMNYQNLA